MKVYVSSPMTPPPQNISHVSRIARCQRYWFLNHPDPFIEHEKLYSALRKESLNSDGHIFRIYAREWTAMYSYILGVPILSLFNTIFLLEFETVLTAWLLLLFFFSISFCFSYFITAQKKALAYIGYHCFTMSRRCFQDEIKVNTNIVYGYTMTISNVI